MFLLDIGLSIFAWRRGWGGWAFLPLIIPFLFTYFMTMQDAKMGPGTAFVSPLYLPLNLACIGVWIYMIIKERD